jgi:hypothetical protein
MDLPAGRFFGEAETGLLVDMGNFPFEGKEANRRSPGGIRNEKAFAFSFFGNVGH